MQARAQATRETILRAAAEIFDRHGYGSATLSDVVVLSGVTKGALYFHFASKEDLATAVVERYEVMLAESRWDRAAAGRALESLMESSYEFASLLVLDVVVRAGVRLTLEQGTFGVMSSRSYGRWLAIVEHLLSSAVAEGDVVASMDASSVARFVVASFTGVQLFSQVFSNRADLFDRVQDMWFMVLPGIVPSRKLAHFRRVAAQHCSTARGVAERSPGPNRQR